MRFDADIAASGTISAPIGTFDSLTVSGIPVSTGTGGGGGSASDLQDAYDGGTGVITTTANKPVAISGTGGLTAVDATVGDFTSTSGTFVQELLYKGEEVAVLSDIVPTSPGEGTTVVSGLITRPLDLSHNPIALWTFQNNDLVDEVSAITLTVNGAGTAQFARIGGNSIFGAVLDGSTQFESSDSSLLNTGDLTFEALIVNAEDAVTGGQNGVICGWMGPTGDGDAANNFISRWTLTSTQQMQYFAEEGTGSPNISFNGGYETRVMGAPRELTHVAMVRKDNQIQFYINGRTATVESVGLAAPNDGSAGKFYISGNNEDTDHFTGQIGSVKVLDKALTAAQILNEYERTLAFVESPGATASTTTASGIIARQLDLTHDPVGFWRMDVDLSDSSGNGADVDQGDSYVRGFIGNGLIGAQENTTTGYTSTTGHSQLQISGNLTIQAIVYIRVFPSANGTSIAGFGIDGGGAETQNWQYLWRLRADGQLHYRYETGAGDQFDFESGSDNQLEVDQRYHIALVRTDNNVQFYVDGRKFGPAQTGANAPTGGSIAILYIHSFAAADIVLSSVKIIDSALTSTQVYAEYARSWPLVPLVTASGGGSSVDETQVALLSQVFGS